MSFEYLTSLHTVQQKSHLVPEWQAKEEQKKQAHENALQQSPPTPEELQQAHEYARSMVNVVNHMDTVVINATEDNQLLNKPTAGGIVLGWSALGIGAGYGLLYHTNVLDKPVEALGHWFAERTKQAYQPLTKGASLLTALGMDAESIMHFKPHAQAAIAPFMLLGALGGAIHAGIFLSSKEKEAARLARFQARNELATKQHLFTQYTPQQLAQAQATLAQHPELVAQKAKDDKEHHTDSKGANLFSNGHQSYKNTMQLYKENDKRYRAWKPQFAQQEAQLKQQHTQIPPSPEEQQRANNDVHNLNTVIKHVELTSQNYMNRAELMATVGLGAANISGMASGWLTQKLICPLLENNKLVTTHSPVYQAVKGFLPVILGGAFALAETMYTVQFVKEFARIGRFKAKQEVLTNPQWFVNRDSQPEETASASTPKKASWADNFTFFKNLPADFKAYQAYKQNTLPYEKALEAVLAQTPTTIQQQQRATQLQKQAYYTFEKVDETTQRLTDDLENTGTMIEQVAAQLNEQGQNALFLILGSSAIGAMQTEKETRAERLQQEVRKASEAMLVKLNGKPATEANIRAILNEEFTQKIQDTAFTQGPAIIAGSIIASNLVTIASALIASNLRKTATQVGVMQATTELEQDPSRTVFVAEGLDLRHL